MSRIAAASLIALLGFASAQPAAAHWQWTRWGMTASEIVAASLGRASMPIQNKHCATGQQMIARGQQILLDGLAFDVAFCATDGRSLTSVELSRFGDPAPLRDLLVSRHGRPASQRGPVTIWSDTSGGNTVTLRTVGGTTSLIEYRQPASGL